MGDKTADISGTIDADGTTLAVRIDSVLIARIDAARGHMMRAIRAAGGRDPTVSDVVRRALLIGCDEILAGVEVVQ